MTRASAGASTTGRPFCWLFLGSIGLTVYLLHDAAGELLPDRGHRPPVDLDAGAARTSPIPPCSDLQNQAAAMVRQNPAVDHVHVDRRRRRRQPAQQRHHVCPAEAQGRACRRWTRRCANCVPASARCRASRPSSRRSRACASAAAQHAPASISWSSRRSSADQTQLGPARFNEAMTADPPLHRRQHRRAEQRAAGQDRRRYATRPRAFGITDEQLRTTLQESASAAMQRRQHPVHRRQLRRHRRIRHAACRGMTRSFRRSACASATARWCRLSSFADASSGHRPGDDQPDGPARLDHGLIQPAGRRRARRRDQRRSTRSRSRSACRRTSSPPTAARRRSSSSRQGNTPLLILAAVADDLCGSRRPLRELHPSADHPVRPAGGSARRPAGAQGVRLRPVDHRRDRPPDADRHRQEERDHDDRRRAGDLRARSSCRHRTRSTKPASARFRPIMMTTFCALLGTLPIALGTGASSELRQPLGIAVVGGLDRLAAADAVHHAGDLRRDGSAEHLARRPRQEEESGSRDRGTAGDRSRVIVRFRCSRRGQNH